MSRPEPDSQPATRTAARTMPEASRDLASPLLCWLGAGLIASTAAAAEPEVTRYGVEESTGFASAVSVSGAELIHLNQLLPIGADGKVVSPGDVAKQLVQLNENLIAAISAAGGDVTRVLKLNFYVTSPQVAETVLRGKITPPPLEFLPALSLVVTSLPDPDALVAVDAVIAGGPGDAAATTVRRLGDGKSVGARLGPAAAILPVGPRVYISGQAEAGSGGVTSAARETLASLGRTLDFLGLTRSDVVQVKAFVTPMTSVGEFEAEVLRFFAGGELPVISSVQWESNLPIEIEMVVSGGGNAAVTDAAGGETIEFLTPPGMTASPVYCRVAKVLAPTTIYTTGIFAGQGLNGEQEVAAVLKRLGEILEQTGSDWRQLAKATYYVADEDTSLELNRQRPKHYDPARPPAASKAKVAGTGIEGHQITIDLIGTRP